MAVAEDFYKSIESVHSGKSSRLGWLKIKIK